MKPPGWALSLAMALGAGLALAGVFLDLGALERSWRGLPEEAVARVDEQLVYRADYERAAAALASDLRRPLTPRDREELLEGLVDELLLVEHGLASGLPQRDPYLRTQIARGVLDGLGARAQTRTPPSEAELRAHYETAPERFAARGRVELDALYLRGDDQARVRQLAERWRAGASLEQLRQESDPLPLPLPAGSLPPAKLRDYLGPELTAHALTLEAGELSRPLASGGGLWLLRVRTIERATTPPFEQVREAVAADLERERGDAALGELLGELREAARIEVAWERL